MGFLGLEFYDTKLADVVETGFDAVIEQLESIKDALVAAKHSHTDSDGDASDLTSQIVVIENIKRAIEAQTAVHADHYGVDSDLMDKPTLVKTDDWDKEHELFDLIVAAREDDDEDYVEHFNMAMKYGTLKDMKDVLTNINGNFNQMKAVYYLLKQHDRGLMSAAMTDTLNDGGILSKNDFKEECKHKVDGKFEAVDGFRVDDMIAQELTLKMYGNTTFTYKDESGSNMMVVGITAMKDNDGNDAFNLAKDMLMYMIDGKFNHNDDVKDMFVSELDDSEIQKKFSTFIIDKDNSQLLAKIKSVGLKYSVSL